MTIALPQRVSATGFSLLDGPSFLLMGDQPLSSEALYRCYLIMELLRSTGEREFPLQLASCFFYIASHDGCLQEEVIQATQLSPSSVSRNVSWLGAYHRLEHRSGLRLVRRERDPDHYKRWRLFLTPKGKQFVNLIECHVDGKINNFKRDIRSFLEHHKSTDSEESDS